MDIEGVAAIVTGGASGLGAATVRRLARKGARVLVADVQAELGDAVADEVGGAFVRTDVTNSDEVQAAVDAAGEMGPVRVLVNCAGIGPPSRTLGRDGTPLELDFFEMVLRINLIGTFNAIRLTAAAMAKTEPVADGGRGVIVNTASVAAFDGQVGQAAYSASKGGIVGMTLPVARDLAVVGIRVNTIAPGLMDTPLLAGLPEPARESLAKQVLFPQRLGEPDEFAHLAYHIVENDYLNGETIRMDGGIRMAPK
ncbi:MAG: 3-hydroxyacyl-CoA dehydrogenase [Acidimicrobiia bacterium]|jgi:NAD(P)-dependent dehydrogenase (short-subunit alcohol dehydrogenase family)